MTAFSIVRRTALGAFTVVAGALLATTAAHAQNYPVSSGQRATAQQVAERGIPLAELTPGAPGTYVVKRGDTLWGIAGMYLQRPWRWPELWGMNLKALPNPHLIFPGQTLYLVKEGGYARLSASAPGEPETVRVSPRTRSDSLNDSALPTLKPHLIEPFLVEPLVVDAETLQRAPRIVATLEQRVLMADGDRVYAKGHASDPLQITPEGSRQFRIYRDAVALKDPLTGEILGYEAQYVGKAELVRGETAEESANGKGGIAVDYVPAIVQLTGTKQEVRAGDRLLPAPSRAFVSYTPRAPQIEVDARVVSIYGGNAVSYAAQNQVIAINRGAQDGIEAGQVLHIMTQGDRIKDSTDAAKPTIKLPSERNGHVMVFRTFDRVSYALILEIHNSVRVGDRLVNPE